MDSDFLEAINWTNRRTQGSLNAPCQYCGELNTEMHHVNHVRKSSLISPKFKDNTYQLMQIRNNKQLAFCEKCHAEIHKGDYSGPSLRTYDSRLSNIEARIVPSPYKAPADIHEKMINRHKKTFFITLILF